MKTALQKLSLLTLLAGAPGSLWSSDYIADLSAEEAARVAVDLDTEEGREELGRLLASRTRAGDTSPIVIAYSATYDVSNLQIRLPVLGAVGRVFNLIPVVGGLFNRLFREFDPPRTLKLRALLFPAANPKGFLLGVHGLQSNARWYDKSGRALAARGVTSLFFDRRGSGFSDSVLDSNGEPMPGHVASSALDHLLGVPLNLAYGDPKEFLEDIQVSYEHLALVRKLQNSAASFHLYANCFGSRVAFAYAQEFARPEEAFASIITTSPGTNMKKGEVETLAEKLNLLSPVEEYQTIDLVDKDFTSNEDALAEMGDDEKSLTLRKVTNRFLLSARGLTKKMRQAFKTQKLRNVPALVLIPSRDEIIHTQATDDTFANSYPGSTLVTWLDAEHMIEFDSAAQADFVSVVSQWIHNPAAAQLGTELKEQSDAGQLPTLIKDKVATYRN